MVENVLRVIAPLALILANSVLGVMIYQSKEDGEEKYSVHLAVLLAESLKFLVCLVIISIESPLPSSSSSASSASSAPSTSSPQPTTPTTLQKITKITKNIEELTPYGIPAMIYAVDNTFYYILLEYFTPPMLMVLQNIKVLVTGVVYTLVFRKQLSLLQWLSLLFVTIGIILVGIGRNLQEQPQPQEDQQQEEQNQHRLVGFALLLFAACLSSFGNVFCEKLLKKGDQHGLSLSQQNLRLYLFGILLNMLWTWANDENTMQEKGIFHDFNVFAVLSVITMAVVGLLISVVFKYLTSIVQVLCSVLSALLVSIISIALGVFEPSSFFVFGSLLIFSGVILYANPNIFAKTTEIEEEKMEKGVQKL